METCSSEVPDMCADIIPYTSYPNRRLRLFEKDAYEELLDEIKDAASKCKDPEAIRWGVCNSVYPRCLMGHQMYLCKDVCIGECKHA